MYARNVPAIGKNNIHHYVKKYDTIYPFVFKIE